MSFDFVALQAEVPNEIYCKAMGIIYSNLSIRNIKTDFELKSDEFIYHFKLSGCNPISGTICYINDYISNIQ